MVNCPKCGRPLYTETFDSEFEDDTYYDYNWACCDWCNKAWKWTNIYKFFDATEMEEIDPNDHL